MNISQNPEHPNKITIEILVNDLEHSPISSSGKTKCVYYNQRKGAFTIKGIPVTLQIQAYVKTGS